MKQAVVTILGCLLLAWAVAYIAGAGFNVHHGIAVLALSLLWGGYTGFVFTMQKKGARS